MQKPQQRARPTRAQAKFHRGVIVFIFSTNISAPSQRSFTAIAG
jgi:hypothetical protein